MVATPITYADFLERVGFPAATGDGKVSFDEAATRQRWGDKTRRIQQDSFNLLAAVGDGGHDVIDQSDFDALLSRPVLLAQLIESESFYAHGMTRYQNVAVRENVNQLPTSRKEDIEISPVSYRRYVTYLQMALDRVLNNNNGQGIDGVYGGGMAGQVLEFETLLPGLADGGAEMDRHTVASLIFYLRHDNHVGELDRVIARLTKKKDHITSCGQEYQSVEEPNLSNDCPLGGEMDFNHALLLSLQYTGYIRGTVDPGEARRRTLEDGLQARHGSSNVTVALLNGLIADLRKIRARLG